MKINKSANNLIAILAGLPKQSDVSLNLGGISYHTAKPADWAGRLTLKINNASNFVGNEVCVEISNPTQSIPSVICHHVIDMAERQVQS